MPNGAVHAKFTLLLTAVTTPAVYFLTRDVGMTVTWGLGVLTGLLLEPDLDQSEIHAITAQEMVGDYLGIYTEYLWRFIWYPYGMLVKHRSWVSHAPIVGTLIRLGYLYVWYLFVCWILRVNPIWYIPPMVYVGGLCAADTLHFLLDWSPFFVSHRRETRKARR